MQFELSSGNPDPARLAMALHQLDPQAQITLDAAQGHLEVFSTASRDQIVHALEQIGCPAQALDEEVHVSGGSTCCGGCS
ncbi:MAG: hypothetical protein M0Q42_11495 [Xanthomonadales bacterium]|nr:hypothetical protein [Xanthomonadales bacterium]